MSGMTVPVESQVKYLKRRSAEVTQIQASLHVQPDWELIKKVGHQLKGNASTFGFAQLADFGKSLESAAMAADIARAQSVSTQLESEVRRLLTSFGQ